MITQERFTIRNNRLIHEQSPYLLQHAHNPVDWYPWGDEAHSQARELDRPLFLSIGYAACHWCHVMEQECFMDEEVAALLNNNFISMKVDREEYPEIDRIYMAVCQLMTGSGGWPLSVFLTPDLKPFYSATFIPKTSGRGMPGMLDLLPYLTKVWMEQREEVYDQGRRIFEALTGESRELSPELKTGTYNLINAAHNAFSSLARAYDAEYGGFGSAPKFPSITQIQFLLTYGEIFQVETAHKMALDTLLSISRGGIRDHIGYGFHRYATDRAWQIPHFEKMLYDQALNAIAYTQGWQITADPRMKRAATECLEYICTTLVQPGGGFASAEDADSPGGEGAFYLWSDAEMSEILTPEEYTLAKNLWGIRPEGNVPHTSGIPQGSNIIAADSRVSERGTGTSEIDPVFGTIREKLYKYREKRIHPRMDDKILTDWNGLAIEALSIAARVMDEPWMNSHAQKAATFIISEMATSDGHLYHRWRNGSAAITGTAQDYIFLASGLVQLFQATGEPDYLAQAIRITDLAMSLFLDEEKGSLYGVRKDDSHIPIRLRDEFDGPTPSANGQAFCLLKVLALITREERYAREASNLAAGMQERIRKTPLGMLSLLDGACKGEKEIRAVITGNTEDPARQALWKNLNTRFIPGLVTIPVIPEYRDKLSDFISDLPTQISDQPAMVWLCSDQTCLPPVSDPGMLTELLDRITHSSVLQDSGHH